MGEPVLKLGFTDHDRFMKEGNSDEAQCLTSVRLAMGLRTHIVVAGMRSATRAWVKIAGPRENEADGLRYESRGLQKGWRYQRYHRSNEGLDGLCFGVLFNLLDF